MTTGDEYVSVLVPKRHLTRVYGFLGTLDEERGSSEGGQEVPDEALGMDWTQDLIERQYRESPPFMKRFQKFLADHPDKEFSTRDLADALDAERGWNTVAGALGAYGRRVKNRYKRSTFPFKSRWDYEKDQAFHRMPAEVANIIRDL